MQCLHSERKTGEILMLKITKLTVFGIFRKVSNTEFFWKQTEKLWALKWPRDNCKLERKKSNPVVPFGIFLKAGTRE